MIHGQQQEGERDKSVKYAHGQGALSLLSIS